MQSTKITSVEALESIPDELAYDRDKIVAAIEDGLKVNKALYLFTSGEIFVVFARPSKEYFFRFADRAAASNGTSPIPLYVELIQKAAVYPKGPDLSALFEEYPLLPSTLADELVAIAKGDGPKACAKIVSSRPVTI